ncbi:hypothetical protein HanPSC8_Chr11g0490991 [Helianthus annuus]|uniref:Uncharacterized protein n=1 Tax=Helianthus annuus TaxID=4232 RepID=A0A251TCJ4_HELAN|nr:hypothetical protein HanHA89_Chr11g0441991 [Helianthus annuus]KAJ0876657.1 hypothetical protein HanPSC8_Chr11g0490991 [Helianthus annuus]
MFKFILISTDSQCIQLEYHRLMFKQRIKVEVGFSNLYSAVRDENGNGNVKLDCPAIGKQFSAE